MDESKLHNLNLSSDEINRFAKAFSDQKFKDLFGEYIKELQNPENQQAFENEITELEKQQGNQVSFIKPSPGYVFKTRVHGNSKAYVNISSSRNVSKLNYVPAEQDSISGLNVSIPYALSPVQRIYDKHNRSCNVYTLVFHPDTLRDSINNRKLKKALEETAFSAIETIFKVDLDKVNLKISKKPFKGSLETTIIRKNSNINVSKNTDKLTLISDQDEYIVPTYKIIYKNEVDLQNSTTDKYCKLDVLIPKQMMIEVYLPLLKSIQDMKLDVKCTSVELRNEYPKYSLKLTLPYEVHEESGSAKFNSDSHLLRIELPVKRSIVKKNPVKVESIPLITEMNENESEQPSIITSINDKEMIGNKDEDSFLFPNIGYKLPDHFCNYLKNQLAFTLKVKNVIENSFKFRILEEGEGFRIKFASLGNGHFSMYYSMCVSFVGNIIEMRKGLDHLIDDENVFVYVHIRNDVKPLVYFVGLDENNLEKRFLNEVDAVKLEIKDKVEEKINIDFEVTEINQERVVINVKPSKEKMIQDFPTLAVKSSKKKKKIELNGVNNPTKDKFFVTSTKEQEQLRKGTDSKITKICKEFRSQISLDEERHSVSESELLVRCTNGSITSHRATSSDIENRSCILEAKNAKKTKRKKKLRGNVPALEENIEPNLRGDGLNAGNTINNVTHYSTSLPIDIRSAYVYSDMSKGSILKKNRSFSESSCDELYHIEGSHSCFVDDANFSSDSCGMSSVKKTVTFNDVILKKLYSSDISILEQRKRSKRKLQRKQRRASDSENSETESNAPASLDNKRRNIRVHNETLLLQDSETELTSLSESECETSDDQRDHPDAKHTTPKQAVPCSKKNHKRRGKKSARKNASTAKHRYNVD